ncbi:hypothetical protein [Gelidibacter mesophilus]|uniref:hypothetical protein n=1 Tax=Gelidibacter mesophilus TaxID=169050 RepID=UPI0003FF955D|nr:hypothetical protein [Gelidibacter mesophilus]
MSNKKSEKEFDPEKDKEVKKGPLKPEHKNQYGGNPGGKSRNLSGRAKAEKERKEKEE